MASNVVKPGSPKGTSVMIIGDIRENSKITSTGAVTGGSEGPCRVQWFRTPSSILESSDGFEALRTPKIAKAFHIPLGIVGLYIVAKFTLMAPDGESGEPAYAISDNSIVPFHLA
ncbi:187-kDa microtubule-associated protein AIR9 [Cucumis melo var. makuwa]|uniref:187-kDa microtubule-associated protein AIR9 n=1 Tax=Cucumis melo var. makuwa TaxID=1194695 RepID=A0A5A7SY79_CUCMM|nr:187-kDa microtubule-associated protein AIR9 [Cucumis melo var. makuwa]